MNDRVTAPDIVPDVEAGVYHLSVEEEPDKGLVIDLSLIHSDAADE